MRMAKKKFSYKSSHLSAEQEFLLEQEKELRQREALLKRRLQERRAKILRTMFAATATTSMPETFLSSREEREKRPSGFQKREKRAARVKFVILLLILVSLLILIWRSLPVR